MKTRWYAYPAVLLLCIFTFSCTLVPVETFGELEIELSGYPESSRTIDSGIPTDVVEIVITGTGPGGATFTARFSPSEPHKIVHSLQPGLWDFAVSGLNADGVTLVCGDATDKEIVSGERKTITMDLLPCQGTGTLNVTVEWPENSVYQPVSDVKLSSIGSAPEQLPMTISGHSATYAGTVNAGFYLITGKLFDGTVKVAGFSSIIRIRKNETLHARFTLTRESMNEAGEAEFMVTFDVKNPVVITEFSGFRSLLVLGETMTVTASINGSADTWQWYLSGEPLAGNSPTIVLGPVSDPGYFELTCTAYAGDRSGSYHRGFTVVSAVKSTSNPILTDGAPGDFDNLSVGGLYTVIRESDSYRLYYIGQTANYDQHIGIAVSSDGRAWTKYTGNPIFGADGDYAIVRSLGTVLKDGPNSYKMYYTRYPAYQAGYLVYLATSTDGVNWTEYQGSGSYGCVYSHGEILQPVVLYDEQDHLYRMWYSRVNHEYNSYLATSTDGIHWNLAQSSPVFTMGGAGQWDSHRAFPGSVIKLADGSYLMAYSGMSNDTSSSIGLAWSPDGVTWTKSAANPVLVPGSGTSWDNVSAGGPSFAKIGTELRLFYGGWNGSVSGAGYAVIR